ncbi:hypothetical protein K503DRAFT_787957 [Rhizopogon vinicolor AM-OR11-026]|uniref:Uncharacterized protein n=1 Tax=Rhizopogon vinicolor AM-OR11-026 TaxID=1314800 RepID=A0A1B7MF77_9AGAM|nr:hypothetical protein K503DRAFT_787957 [Rhizopogon vinicolor AM-OR11-026]
MILPELALVRYLYILPPFHLKAVSPRNSHPCDPLDIFATSHLPPNLSRMRSGINPEDNSRRPSTRITQPSSTPSSAVNTHPRNLKNTNWWTILTDRAVSLIVDVPLAHDQMRQLATGGGDIKGQPRPKFGLKKLRSGQVCGCYTQH